MKYFLFLVPVLAGCADLNRPLLDMGGAGAGAALGHYASGGKLGPTLGGAAAGVGAAELLQYYKTKGEGRAFQSGYDKGRSDAIKDQYWMQQNIEQARSSLPNDKVTLYPIPIPEQEVDGVKLQPTTRILRIHQ